MNTETQAYEKIRGWIHEKSGIIFPEQKTDLLKQRLGRVVKEYRLTSLAELEDRLFSGADQATQLSILHAATTNHTYFFREPEAIDYFIDQIYPKYAQHRELKIWSAASSTGDEAYSIAIAIAEKYGMEGLRRVSILGTDLSNHVIDTAERGVFGHRHFDRTPRAIIDKYFDRIGDDAYQVKRDIRNRCTFRRLNLKAAPYPFQRPFQVVFCRNVFYYFNETDQAKVLNAIYQATDPGGYLITSVTESVYNLNSPWKKVGTGILTREDR